MSQVLFSHRSDDGVPPADLQLAKAIAETLAQHYPGWPWAITADHEQGIATIKNHMLHERWGFLFKIGANDTPTALYRAVVRAGGELLERFGIPRGPMTEYALSHKKNEKDVIAEGMKDERRRRRLAV